MAHKKRHHASHKRHLSAHDREMDRKNLMHGRSMHMSKMDREDEHMGMERYERGPVREESRRGHQLDGYAGMDTREKNQYKAGEYVDESRTGYADMPQQVEYKKYASMPYGLDEYLDDGIGGIDRQVMEDRDMVRRGLQPKKY